MTNVWKNFEIVFFRHSELVSESPYFFWRLRVKAMTGNRKIIYNLQFIIHNLQLNSIFAKSITKQYAMTTISSKEFVTHQDKYFNMAIGNDVRIKRRRNMFRLVYEPLVEEQVILQPDDDLRRAITMDELRDSALEFIDKLYAGK